MDTNRRIILQTHDQEGFGLESEGKIPGFGVYPKKSVTSDALAPSIEIMMGEDFGESGCHTDNLSMQLEVLKAGKRGARG